MVDACPCFLTACVHPRTAWQAHPTFAMARGAAPLCCADEQTADGRIPDWACQWEDDLKWCDGECFASSDDRCCEKECTATVNVNSGTGDFGCSGKCTTGEQTPGCCDYQTQVWCDGLEWIPTVPPSEFVLAQTGALSWACENNGGRCIDKDTEGNVLCASTCIVVTSDEGKKTLECSSDTSRAHRICPDPDDCDCEPRNQQCGLSERRQIYRTLGGRWKRVNL